MIGTVFLSDVGGNAIFLEGKKAKQAVRNNIGINVGLVEAGVDGDFIAKWSNS